MFVKNSRRFVRQVMGTVSMFHQLSKAFASFSSMALQLSTKEEPTYRVREPVRELVILCQLPVEENIDA
jgi:hypothetical protein